MYELSATVMKYAYTFLPFLLILACACQKEEDAAVKAYRMAFTGKYDLVSIYAEDEFAYDLNRDGKASKNLIDELIEPATQSLFSFRPAGDSKYDGQFRFQCPVQAIMPGVGALPPYTVYTPVDYLSGFVSYVISFEMTLEKGGVTSWSPALQDEPDPNVQLHVALLRDAEVLSAEAGVIEVLVRKVPIYDCLKKELIVIPLTYRLEHE